jgi:phosphonate transport system substrate-binding protein
MRFPHGAFGRHQPALWFLCAERRFRLDGCVNTSVRRVLLTVAGAGLVLASLLGGGCLGDETDMTVRLDERTDIGAVGASPPATPQAGTLRIAIAGVMSPSRTLDAYDQLLSYLGERLGVRVTVDQRSSYAEVNELLRTGQADLAFVCSRAYLEGKEQFGMRLLLAPEVEGERVYYSYLIVPVSSTATSLADLRGKVFAFSDPLSNSGKLVPEFQLFLLGETPNSFFERYEYTGSHDDSILAVAEGLVDGAAVDSLVFDYVVDRNPEIGRRVKVIARWGPYGIPPLVAAPGLDPAVERRVREALLGMADDPQGRRALDALGIDRFVTIDDSAYDSIREMLRALQEAGR